MTRRLVLALAMALAAPASGATAPADVAGLEPPPEGVAARSVAERVEDNLRGSTAITEAIMTVVNPRLPAPREVGFRSWDDRHGDRSFIRILSPPKDEGVGFLKLPPNLWNYIPRVERTVRIPPSMMLQSWMGSDFTNDDLVRDSSNLDDYDHHFLGVDPAYVPAGGEEPRRAYVIEYVPHEEAPVVWGRIIAWIDAERAVALRQDFYDEDGEKVRTMRMSDVRPVGERFFPYRWSMVPLDKEGHETRIDFRDVDFDVEIDPQVFTKRNLSRGE